jgi:hypothetical protein
MNTYWGSSVMKEIKNQHNKVNTSAGFDKHGRELFHVIDADEAHEGRGYLLDKLAAVEHQHDNDCHCIICRPLERPCNCKFCACISELKAKLAESIAETHTAYDDVEKLLAKLAAVEGHFKRYSPLQWEKWEALE